jgi:hypothetical protein
MPLIETYLGSQVFIYIYQLTIYLVLSFKQFAVQNIGGIREKSFMEILSFFFLLSPNIISSKASDCLNFCNKSAVHLKAHFLIV